MAKIIKSNKPIRLPRFGGGLIANNARPQSSGKTDLHGVFTIMYAWGYPAARVWTLVMTVFDVPRIKTTIHIGISRKGSKEVSTLATIDLKDEKNNNADIINIELANRFQRDGDYEIICSLKDSSSKLRIPIRIVTRDWPTFNENELKILEQNKSLLPHKVTAQVTCRKCNQHYVFEEKILPNEKYSGGTIPFPDNGVYVCENCDHKLNLKDIQGQIRASIKDNFIQFINSKPNV